MEWLELNSNVPMSDVQRGEFKVETKEGNKITIVTSVCVSEAIQLVKQNPADPG